MQQMAMLEAFNIPKQAQSRWRESKVRYIGQYINGYAFKPDDWGDAGKPILRIQNLTDPSAKFNRYDGQLPDTYLVRDGDILISWSASLGVFRWSGEDAWLNQHIFKVIVNEELVCPDYFVWLAAWFIGELAERVHGSTMQHLTREAFEGFVVFLPPDAQQHAIAAFLDAETAQLDALIRAKERLLERLAEKRRALVTRAVTRGLNSDAPIRPSGVAWLGDIPAHWGVAKIKHLGRVGNGSTPLRENLAYWENGTFPWLTSTVVNADIVGQPTEFVTDTALKECHLPIVEPRSVLVAITGQGKTRGNSALLPYRAAINQHLAYISPQETVLSAEFLQLLLSASYEILRILSEGTGSTKGALTCEQLGEFMIPIPPVVEQQAIVNDVTQDTARLDALHTATANTIALLRERRSALIAAAVTGDIEVGA